MNVFVAKDGAQRAAAETITLPTGTAYVSMLPNQTSRAGGFHPCLSCSSDHLARGEGAARHVRLPTDATCMTSSWSAPTIYIVIVYHSARGWAGPQIDPAAFFKTSWIAETSRN